MDSMIYRAKRIDTNEWVYGYYAKVRDYLTDKYVHIMFPTDTVRYPHGEFDEHYEVIPETVGRLLMYTNYDGYHEVDRIFQNDIIEIWPRYSDVEKDIALVQDEHSVSVDGFGRWFPQDTTRIRVIGNAYDNPELLKGHSLNHFVNQLNYYPGDASEYLERHRHLTQKYNIHGAQARCYMCNFENDYICHQFNSGCSRIDVCRKIREEGD
jgi:hypothetical protein